MRTRKNIKFGFAVAVALTFSSSALAAPIVDSAASYHIVELITRTAGTPDVMPVLREDQVNSGPIGNNVDLTEGVSGTGPGYGVGLEARIITNAGAVAVTAGYTQELFRFGFSELTWDYNIEFDLASMHQAAFGEAGGIFSFTNLDTMTSLAPGVVHTLAPGRYSLRGSGNSTVLADRSTGPGAFDSGRFGGTVRLREVPEPSSLMLLLPFALLLARQRKQQLAA